MKHRFTDQQHADLLDERRQLRDELLEADRTIRGLRIMLAILLAVFAGFLFFSLGWRR